MSDFSNDWTSDMSVPLPENTSVDEITKFVINKSIAGESWDEIENNLVLSYGLDQNDIALIIDRVLGGITRVASGHSGNRPNPESDPFAFSSFTMAIKNRDIITFFHPDKKNDLKTFEDEKVDNDKPWWKFW
jgi:hypothetical protein